MSRSPVAVSTAPAPKKRTLLNRAWLKTWRSAAVRARARGCRKTVGLESERKAETHEDEADVLDGAAGEDPLEVALHQRVENAEHGGSAADRQDRDAPPPSRRAEEVEDDPHEAVDRDFGHDAAHQRGDMARRRRMRERQPDVQGHEPGLRSGAEEGKYQHEGGGQRCEAVYADCGKGVAPVGPRKQSEGEQERQRAEARHEDVHIAGADIRRFAVMGHDECPRGERHEFPGRTGR